MEKMMGVKEPMPDEIVDSIVEQTKVNPRYDLYLLCRTLMGLVKSHRSLAKTRDAFYQRLHSALDLPVEKLEQMEAQAREIDELKALLLMQNQPYMETSGRRYPSPSTYRQYPSPAAYRVGTQSQPIYDAGVIKTSSPYRQEQGRLHPHAPGPVNQGFPSPYPHGYGQQAPMPYPYAHPQATY